MSITESNGKLEVTGDDHARLYELYCENEVGEQYGPFTFVASQHSGTWRHGSVHLLVVEVEGREGLWGTTVQDQDGDEYWSSLDPSRGYGDSAGLAPVKAIQSVKYEVVR